MDVLPLLCVVSVALTGLTTGAGVLPAGLNATVGGTVMFTTTLTPPEIPFTIVWTFGERAIITVSDVTTNEPEYEDRITLFRSTGSLELRNLTLNDTGEYSVRILLSGGGGNRDGSTEVVVYERVLGVTATPSSTDLVEFNSSVRLSCSVSSGSSLSFLWLNGSSEVTASRVQITDGGSNLTIVNVTRYDQGPFLCRVSNPVSNGTSDPVNLSISFGPENTNLSPSHSTPPEGSDIILSCSADSRPAALFKWFLNGDLQSDTGPELRLMNIQKNQSGNYSCQAFNNKTERYETSQPAVVSVLARVGDVVVTLNSTDLVEFNSSVRLSCSVSSGSSLSFLWLNGSSEVTASDRVQLTDGGSTLTIVNVTRYDQGPFRCLVFNPFSNGTSDPINLSISYGPENISLTISHLQQYYGEGSNISLMCSADSRPAALFKWFLNGDLQSDTGPELRLMNIQMSHSGNYSCQAFNNQTLRYETSQPAVVSVLARVAYVVVTLNSTDLVEFNSSVRLSCSVSSGSSLSFLWLNGSSEVTASDRVQLTGGGSTLTIVNVTRYDQGPYWCLVFNPFSNGTSDPINLSISYGPENISLTISHLQKYYGEGSNISLMCSADSRPAALFKWFLNGDLQSDTGPVLRLMNIQMSHSGNYSCQAFNNQTLRYETSQPAVISVLERISGVSVTPSTHLSIEGNSFNLTCDAAGSLLTRRWLKDGSDVNLNDNNIMLYDEKRVLSFQPLKRKDSGEYSCEISNPISSAEARYNMVVNYGPENVHITGPNQIDFDQTLTLTCSAESTPFATFIWSLNGTEIHNSPVFTKDTTDSSDSGNYTCQAMNNITGRTSSAAHQLSVTELPPPSSPCSVGCIIAIVIACVGVCVAVAVAAWYYLYRNKASLNRKRAEDSPGGNTSTRTGAAAHENGAYSRSEELHYSDLRFPPKKEEGTVQLQNDSSEYSEVRPNNNNVRATSTPPTYDVHMQRMQAQTSEPAANVAPVYAQAHKK